MVIQKFSILSVTLKKSTVLSHTKIPTNTPRVLHLTQCREGEREREREREYLECNSIWQALSWIEREKVRYSLLICASMP